VTDLERESLFGDYALIGASDENSDRGAAYVFKRSGSSWTQQQKLTASDGGSSEFFGNSVSITEDYALVGAPNNVPNFRKGAAYIFTRSGSTWTQQQKLVASDAPEYKYFGDTVSLSADFALVGTKYNEKAYLFERSGSSWTELYKMTASDNQNGYGFGSTQICISGNDAVIGSYEDDSDKGSAYVFEVPLSTSPPPPPTPTTASPPPASSQISLPTGTKLYKSSPSSGSGCTDSDETCSCSSSYTVLRVSDTNYRFTSNFDPSTEPSCPTGYQCYVLEISGTLNGDKDVLSGTGVMGGQNIGQASIARMGADTYTTFAGSCTYTYSTNKHVSHPENEDDEPRLTRREVGEMIQSQRPSPKYHYINGMYIKIK